MPDSAAPLPLSVFWVTCNEEANLPRSLASAAALLPAEIVVVDSGSTDRTREVAERFGATWIEQPWLGMRDQKNFALGQCREPWVLNLDADEEISPGLAEEIRAFFASGPPASVGALGFPRCSWFLGRWIRHGDWYPDRKVRLFRRGTGSFIGDAGHDRVELDPGAETRWAVSDLFHYSYRDTTHFLRKLADFSDLHLRAERERGGRWSLAGNLSRPAWRFFRGYVLRGGFLDGFPGLWIAAATAFATFVRHSRLYESSRPRLPMP